jgi:hypothetical protein
MPTRLGHFQLIHLDSTRDTQNSYLQLIHTEQIFRERCHVGSFYVVEGVPVIYVENAAFYHATLLSHMCIGKTLLQRPVFIQERLASHLFPFPRKIPCHKLPRT